MRYAMMPLLAATMLCSGCGLFKQRAIAVRSVGEAPVAMAQGGYLAEGQRQFAAREYALAIDAFRRAVRQNPGDAQGYHGLAVSYATLGRYDLSDRFFELALARAPGDTKIYRNLARSLDARGDVARAAFVREQMAEAGRIAEYGDMPPRQLAIGEGRAVRVQLSEAVRAPLYRKPQAQGPHLERETMGEVMLVTRLPDCGSAGEDGACTPTGTKAEPRRTAAAQPGPAPATDDGG